MYGKKIKTDYQRCMTYEPGKACHGASGRKLRQDCVYCPNYERHIKRKEEKQG